MKNTVNFITDFFNIRKSILFKVMKKALDLFKLINFNFIEFK